MGILVSGHPSALPYRLLRQLRDGRKARYISRTIGYKTAAFLFSVWQPVKIPQQNLKRTKVNPADAVARQNVHWIIYVYNSQNHRHQYMFAKEVMMICLSVHLHQRWQKKNCLKMECICLFASCGSGLDCCQDNYHRRLGGSDWSLPLRYRANVRSWLLYKLNKTHLPLRNTPLSLPLEKNGHWHTSH